jgi:plastocyanin
MKPVSMLFVVAAMGLAAACSEDETGVEDCTSTATKVCMADDLFDPSTLTVARGATVTWQNADDDNHTATSNPANPAGCPTFDVAVSGGNTSTAVTFNPAAAATCQYYCKIHATPTTGAMRATIVVQ